MKIQIREHNVEITPALRAHVERRLSFALGRFGERIGQVIVQFSPSDGQRGADETRCKIQVGLRPQEIHAEDTAADGFSALDHAAGRVSRSVARALQLERD